MACAILIVGCGRFGFGSRAAPDAAPDAMPDAAPIPACTVAACPAGYGVMTSGTATGCYKLVIAPQMWLDAELACEAEGAHLVVEDSVDEHVIIHNLAAAQANVWVGWSDRRGPDNTFTWVVPDMGGLLQSNPCVFGAGEPDAGDPDHCVMQAGTNNCPDYQDVACELGLPSVCECDGVLADPTRY